MQVAPVLTAKFCWSTSMVRITAQTSINRQSKLHFASSLKKLMPYCKPMTFHHSHRSFPLITEVSSKPRNDSNLQKQYKASNINFFYVTRSWITLQPFAQEFSINISILGNSAWVFCSDISLWQNSI